MCNTTCNNHTHEEYNVDYINQEETLDITVEDVPCDHEQNIYIVQDDDNYNHEDDCECNCNCSKCGEPKKVSCRSLACKQLNEECSCKRKKKNIRKTTMVNMLENNVLRLEDKMNDGCESMHKNIEQIVDNINLVYNELKDEEGRAKKAEAFLQYQEDLDINYVKYVPETRMMLFWHVFTEVTHVDGNTVPIYSKGCYLLDQKESCDCCETCKNNPCCQCNCVIDEKCKAEVPHTLDENCNMIPLHKEDVLLFEIDCTDFLRDIFVSNAYIRDDVNDDPDKKHGPILVIEFNRYLEPGLEDDDLQPQPPIQVEVDLSKIWNLENYYDKELINELANAIFERICAAEAELNRLDQKIDATKRELNQTINNTKNELNQNINNTKNELNNTINNTKNELQEIINNIDTDVDVTNLDVVVPLGSNTPTAFAKVKGQDIKIKIAAPDEVEFDVNVDNKNATLNPGSNNLLIATVDGDPITVNVPQSNSVSVTNNNATLTPGTSNLQIASIDNTPITVNVPSASPSGNQVAIQNATLVWGTAVKYGTINGTDVYLTLPAEPQPGEGADGNDYVVSGTVNSNNELILTRKDGGTVPPIQLPLQPEPKHITNVTQEGDTVTFTWSDNSTPTTINVGGACLWKEYNDGLIPANESKKVYGAGFYDTTVS